MSKRARPASIYTGALRSYDGLDEFTDQVIDQPEAYVHGNVHTNSTENFWNLPEAGLERHHQR
jgi:hypothetical protein